MNTIARRWLVLASVLGSLVLALPVSAQVTTGTVSGTVKDAQGGVVPGATIVLTSEARGTQMAPVVSNETGDFVVPNATADTYTVEVSWCRSRRYCAKACRSVAAIVSRWARSCLR